jgi:hypothetical protein
MGGGVCTVLDYEVDMMADYVSEMATRVVTPRSSVNAAFRKFVNQILSSTRLPSTTILLGLNYLAKRVNVLGTKGQSTFTDGQVWRMLTISLVLGSKFLDDNTFHNMSWSEVSGIPVRELNSLEFEWLGNMEWCLYVNLDESKDYQAWLTNWRDWRDTKLRAAAQQAHAQATRDRLAALVPPLNTSELPRPRAANYSTWHQQQIAEYERLSSMKRNQPVHVPTPVSACGRDQPSWGNCYSSAWSAPLTPPDSGYGGFGTPATSSGSATSTNARYAEWFDRALASGHAQRPFQGYASHASQAPVTTGYRSGVAHFNNCRSMWDNMADCSCASYGLHNKRPHSYMMGSHHYPQPVMG